MQSTGLPLRVPEPDRPIVAARRDGLAVRSKNRGVDFRLPRRHAEDFASRTGVEHVEDAVSSSGRQAQSVRRELDIVERFLRKVKGLARPDRTVVQPVPLKAPQIALTTLRDMMAEKVGNLADVFGRKGACRVSMSCA